MSQTDKIPEKFFKFSIQFISTKYFHKTLHLFPEISNEAR